MRLESMAWFDRVSEQCLLDLEERKEMGEKVIGVYCTFAPTELIRAAGAIPIGLCGKDQAPIYEAEKVLPANLCPLIKSSYGYAASDTCPFFSASDILIGETTCDGKKKMFELLQRIKPLFLMQLPNSAGKEQLASWIGEILKLKDFLEGQTGTKIDQEELQRQIRVQNKIRKLLKDLLYRCADDRVPISGLDMMTVMESSNFIVDPGSYVNSLHQLARELETKAGETVCGANAPRILLTGCPVGKGSEKVLRLVEQSGGIVVCQEHCTGIKSFDLLVDEDDDDPYAAIARRYLKTPCSCMTPNQGRIELLGRLIKDFNIQGIVDLTWQCCHTYNVESYFIEEFTGKEYGLPLLHIETDYSSSDTEQLRTRIEAFLELLANIQ